MSMKEEIWVTGMIKIIIIQLVINRLRVKMIIIIAISE